MDIEVLTKAATSYLDSAASVVNWTVLVSLVMIWSGVSGSQRFELKGLTLTRRNVALMLSTFYCVALFIVFVQLLRLDEALRSFTDDLAFRKVATEIVANAWILNPFSYVSGDWGMLVVNALPAGLWPLFWSAMILSVISLRDRKNVMTEWQFKTIAVAFVLASAGVLMELFWLTGKLGFRLYEIASDIGKPFLWGALFRIAAFALGTWLGVKAIKNFEKLLPKLGDIARPRTGSDPEPDPEPDGSRKR